MKLIVNYFDNAINFNNNIITSLEVENKNYFYRIVHNLYQMCNNEIVEEFYLTDENNNEVNYSNKFKLFIDFFDFKLNSKKYINDIVKYINKNIGIDTKNALLTQYNKILSIYKKQLNEIDLPLIIDSEFDIETITKLIKIDINQSDNLLENLFTLIDLENIFETKNILIFVNLKQYLTKKELEELYKYSVYNEIQLLLIDSQSYGITLKNEKKIIIDENLDEFVL